MRPAEQPHYAPAIMGRTVRREELAPDSKPGAAPEQEPEVLSQCADDSEDGYPRGQLTLGSS